MNKETTATIMLMIAALLVWLLGSSYHLTLGLQLFMMIALAQSWNLISGMTGYVSFGHAAFFGLGAYSGTIILQSGSHWLVALLAGAMTTFLIAIPLGLLTLRLRGPYFAIAMLGLNELGRICATLWVSMTEGGDGIALSPTLLPALSNQYLAMLGLAILACGMVAWIHNNRFGLELRAIRDGEDVAEMVGINTVHNKVLAFVLSAIIPGAVGAIYAMFTSFIDPASVFDPALNIQMIVMVLLGGAGTVWGPVLGAGIVMGLHELFWANAPEIHLILLGLLLIGIILYLPQGVLSIVSRRKRVRPDQLQNHHHRVTP